MRQVWIGIAVVAVALAAAVAGLFLWLRTYDPLAATKPIAPGAAVEPRLGSRGKPVFVPTSKTARSFPVTFTLHNRGRFAVTVTGLATGDVRIDPHAAGLVTVRWPRDCGQAPSDRVQLRYRYLSLFRRTVTVELPFAVTSRCSQPTP